MSHSRYVALIALAGVISFMAFALVLYKMDPFESTGLALALFFVSLFFTLTAFFTVVGYYLRVWFNKNEIYYDHINVSLRQGILLTVIVEMTLIFQLLLVLNWISGLLLVAIITMVEFYLVAKS